MEEKDLQPNGGVNKDVSADVKVESAENLSKSDIKAIDKGAKKKEKRAWNEKRRIKRGKKALRGRKLKNLAFFTVGIFTGIVLLISGIFVGLKFVPMKTYFGNDDKYVKSETAGEKSLIDFIMSIGDYQISDVPVLEDVIDSLVNGAGLNSIFTIDTDKLHESGFNDIGNGIMNSAKISKDLFGDLKDLEMFETVKVPDDEDPSNPENGITEFEPKLYYYAIEETDTAPGEQEGGKVKYARAFNDDKTRVEGTEGKQLYYLSLTEMNINDLKSVFSERFKLLKVKSVFETLAGVKKDSFINDVLGDRNIKDLSSFDKNDIKIETALGDYEEGKNDKLYKLIWDASQYEKYEDPETGATIVNHIEPGTKVVYEYEKDPETQEYILDGNGERIKIPGSEKTIPDYSELTLADMASDKFDINMARLETVLGKADSSKKEKLYKLIWDASHYNATKDPETDEVIEVSYDDIPKVLDPVTGEPIIDTDTGNTINDFSSLTLDDLSGSHFDVNMARLTTVLLGNSENNDNVLIKKLLAEEEPVRLGNLAKKINNMRIEDLYDIECFTQDAALAKSSIVKYVKYTDDYSVAHYVSQAEYDALLDEYKAAHPLDGKEYVKYTDGSDHYVLQADYDALTEQYRAAHPLYSVKIEYVKYINEDNKVCYELKSEYEGHNNDYKTANPLEYKEYVKYTDDYSVAHYVSQADYDAFDEDFKAAHPSDGNKYVKYTGGSDNYVLKEEYDTYSVSFKAAHPVENTIYYIHGISNGSGDDEDPGNRPAGIWLFTLYDNGYVLDGGEINHDAIDGYGYAKKYVDKELCFKNLRGNINNASENFMNTTVRQMYLAGLIKSQYRDRVMELTLNNVLTTLDQTPSA